MTAILIVLAVLAIATGAALLNLFGYAYVPGEQYSLTSRPPTEPHHA